MSTMKRIDRRKFLEITSSIAGTSVLAASMPWLSVFSESGLAPKGPSDRVRIGIIGVGSRGRALLLNLQTLTERLNFEIVAVCDNYVPHYERAIKLTNGKAEGFLDYRDMLKMDNLDGVVIATPLFEHAKQTIDALKAGINVYCEKAMARHLHDVKQMYDTQLETGKILMIGHQKQFNPIYIQGIEQIHNGNIGPLVMLKSGWHRNRDWIFYEVPGGRGSALDRQRNWRLYDEYSAGMISELGSHDFQAANWIMDSQPVSVMGTGSINFFHDGREVYDNFALIFNYPGDISMTYDCTTANKFNGQFFQVLGNEGTFDFQNNKVYSEEPPSPPAIRSMIHNIERNIFETIPIGGATWLPDAPVKYGGNYITEDYKMNDTQLALEAFVEYIRVGKVPDKLLKTCYQASIWTLLALEATKTGTVQTLPKEYII
ncbi:MAG: Gfo/Idh/MocA family oxidoreductase [Balneolales bacterium]